MRFLHVIEGPDQGATWALPDHEPQLIGRSTEALPITDHEVSRRHAELTPDDGRWLIRDLESTNGTRVNGRPIEDRVELRRGDRIQCGTTVLLFDETPEGAIPIRAVEETAARLELVAPEEVDEAAGDPPARDHLALLLQATELAARHVSAEDALDAFMTLLLDAFEAEHVAMMILPSDERSASTVRVRRQRARRSEPIEVNRELVRLAQAEPDRTLLAWESREEDGSGRWLVAGPLRSGERIRGVACIACPGPREAPRFSPRDLELIRAVNGLAGMACEHDQLDRELRSSSRLAAMGETVAAISHGIKNILQGLRGGADAVRMGLEREDLELARRGWPVVARNLERVQALTMNMLGFTREGLLDREPAALASVAGEAVQMLETRAERAGVEIRLEGGEEVPPIPLDPAGVLQIIINLVSNAIDIAPRGSAVTLELGYDPETGRVRLEVRDSGPGIDPSVRDRLFEPFVTSKGQRGTGLGLVVSRRIAEQHGGTLDCVRTGSRGTLMRLELPADGIDESPEDTRGPRGVRESDLGLDFGPPEH